MPSSHSPGELSLFLPLSLSLSLSPVCGFGAGQWIRKIVEREREDGTPLLECRMVVCLVAL
jgi:hypothetical protein